MDIHNNDFLSNAKISDLAGIYKELAELIGYENVLIVYNSLQGQQVTFPKRLYTKEYTKSEIFKLYNGTNVKYLAKKFDYTECHIYRILKIAKSKITNNADLD